MRSSSADSMGEKAQNFIVPFFLLRIFLTKKTFLLKTFSYYKPFQVLKTLVFMSSTLLTTKDIKEIILSKTNQIFPPLPLTNLST